MSTDKKRMSFCGSVGSAEALLERLKAEREESEMSEQEKKQPRCECNYHLGMGPNLNCPVHWERNQSQYGLTPLAPEPKAEVVSEKVQ